jgi:hypothetical protein
MKWVTPVSNFLAKVLAGHESKEAHPEPRSRPKPLLKAWPKGYEGGSFRVVDGGVLLFAKGKPTLKIEDSGTVPPKKSGAPSK